MRRRGGEKKEKKQHNNKLAVNGVNDWVRSLSEGVEGGELEVVKQQGKKGASELETQPINFKLMLILR